MRSRRHPLGQLARRELARFCALMLGLTVLVGALRGGTHYFYCPFMNAVVTEHCCAALDEPAAGDERGAVMAVDCCQDETTATLPSAESTARSTELEPAPLLAFIPPFDFVRSAPVRRGSHATIERAGGPSPTQPPRARLMVFLI